MTFNHIVYNCNNFNEFVTSVDLRNIKFNLDWSGEKHIRSEDLDGQVAMQVLIDKIISLYSCIDYSKNTGERSFQDTMKETRHALLVLKRLKEIDLDASTLLNTDVIFIIFSLFKKLSNYTYSSLLPNHTVKINEIEQRIKTDQKKFQNRYPEFGKVEAIHIRKRDCYTDALSENFRKYDNPKISGECVGVYITSNESHQEYVSQVLETYPKKPNSVHIGFSSWHNFDIIYKRKSTYALLADFNPGTTLFLYQTLFAIIKSPTREVFVETLLNFIEQNSSRFKENIFFSVNVKSEDPCSNEEEIRRELKQNGSWLSTDESFEYIQKLAQKDKIVLMTNDIRNSKDFKEIADLLSKNSLVVDTLYVSNISNYMCKEQEKEAYKATLDYLIQDDTLIIDCQVGELQQRVSIGKTSQDEVKIDRQEQIA